jgi:hypothetical protein
MKIDGRCHCGYPTDRASAKLAFPVHPHMLRHSTGYKLAPTTATIPDR